eukprot:350767-Chlamydomonas_euryale.AAC.2
MEGAGRVGEGAGAGPAAPERGNTRCGGVGSAPRRIEESRLGRPPCNPLVLLQRLVPAPHQAPDGRPPSYPVSCPIVAAPCSNALRQLMYSHVDPKCLEESPTAKWWAEYFRRGFRQQDLVAHVEDRADFDGLAVKWGIGNKKASVEDCAAECLAHVPGAIPGAAVAGTGGVQRVVLGFPEPRPVPEPSVQRLHVVPRRGVLRARCTHAHQGRLLAEVHRGARSARAQLPWRARPSVPRAPPDGAGPRAVVGRCHPAGGHAADQWDVWAAVQLVTAAVQQVTAAVQLVSVVPGFEGPCVCHHLSACHEGVRVCLRVLAAMVWGILHRKLPACSDGVGNSAPKPSCLQRWCGELSAYTLLQVVARCSAQVWAPNAFTYSRDRALYQFV